MKKKNVSFLSILLAALLVILLPRIVRGRSEVLESFDEQHRIKLLDNEYLVLNGTAIHRRFIFDVYELSLYLRDYSRDAGFIMRSSDTKYAKLKFLRDLRADEVREAFAETYRENCAEDCLRIKDQMDQMIASIPDMAEQSVIDFVFFSDRSEIAIRGGSKMEFAGPYMGRFFIRAWIGKTPPSERFKRELLGLAKL